MLHLIILEAMGFFFFLACGLFIVYIFFSLDFFFFFSFLNVSPLTIDGLHVLWFVECT